MNNPLIDTAICWETRNWRHHKKTIEWCKNYGLSPLTKHVFIGKLKKSEMLNITQNFEDLFIKKTEKFHIIPLCKLCYSKIYLHKISKDELEPKLFEIV
jgi:CRISPR/Cas system-associated endoribonuclease Cas2